jgi:hypothetical protein
MNTFNLEQYKNTSANEVALFKNIPIDLIEVARSAVREFQAKNPTLGKYRFRFRGSNRPQSHCPRNKANRFSVYFYKSHHNVSY